jgi:hypothetical protein
LENGVVAVAPVETSVEDGAVQLAFVVLTEF